MPLQGEPQFYYNLSLIYLKCCRNPNNAARRTAPAPYLVSRSDRESNNVEGCSSSICFDPAATNRTPRIQTSRYDVEGRLPGYSSIDIVIKKIKKSFFFFFKAAPKEF